MKIYKQLNHNDCGISVTQSLINHFYSFEVSKEELYENCNISESGISILDLQILNKKYGINLESYEADYESFLNYPLKNYFILLSKTENLFHYVIAKKEKKYLIIFDSIKGKIKVLYSELEKNFTNIFISINLEKKIESIFSKIKKNKNLINYEKIIKHFLIDVVVLIFSVVSNYFIKWIFEYTFGTSEIYELAQVIFMSLIFYFLISLGNYIQGYLKFEDKNYYKKSLLNTLLISLENKKNNFFKKIGKKQFLLLMEHIENISTYYSEYLNKWFINLIFFILLINFTSYMHIYFLPIIFISIICNLIYFYFSKKEYKKNIPKILDFQSEFKKLNFELKRFVNDEINLEKLKQINFGIKNCFSLQTCNEKKFLLKNLFFEKTNLFFENLIFLSLCICGSIFYIKNQLSFGHLMILSTCYGYINKSFYELINFYFFKTNFNYSQKIYQQFIGIDEINEIENENWFMPKKIKIKDLVFYNGKKKLFKNLNLNIKNGTFLFGQSGIGKSTLYKLIAKKINFLSGNIFWDKENMKNLSNRKFNENVIYQISNSWIEKIDLKKIFFNFSEKEQKCLEKILKIFEINIEENINFSKLSSGQKQFLNFLNLFNYSGKILLLDEIFSHINLENKKEILKYLMPILVEKNFVICSEHDMKLKNFFKYSENLNSHV